MIAEHAHKRARKLKGMLPGIVHRLAISLSPNTIRRAILNVKSLSYLLLVQPGRNGRRVKRRKLQKIDNSKHHVNAWRQLEHREPGWAFLPSSEYCLLIQHICQVMLVLRFSHRPHSVEISQHSSGSSSAVTFVIGVICEEAMGICDLLPSPSTVVLQSVEAAPGKE